ncbi:peptidase S8 [bacterium]|nr:peptidase S8 [candidate division CSSED10-310 bacterium]
MKQVLGVMAVLAATLSIGTGPAGSADRVEMIQRSFGSEAGDENWNRDGDLNGDGVIDGHDLTRAVASETARPPLALQQYLQDHVLVKFADVLTVQAAANLISKYHTEIRLTAGENRTGYKRVTLPLGESVPGFLEKLAGEPGVLAAQPDYICRKLGEPNDPYYNLQWNFHLIGAPAAWDLSLGGRRDVVVAIVDTGIAFENHGDYQKAPDLEGTRFVSGYDFINSDSHPNDDEGHGTHVAGTVAQATNNEVGVAGLAYRTALMPVKVLDAVGSGTAYSLSEGLRWAVDHGADVINMSLGFPGQVDPGPIVRDAVRYAHSNGVICVAAAGNAANDPAYRGGIEYPAAYEECIGVGATQYRNQRAYYSNWGTKITCVAPGGDVRVDLNGDGYGDGILQQTFAGNDVTDFGYYFYQGTSMASPHVAAAAALYLSRHGGDPQEFFTVLVETCTDLGPDGFDTEYGYGLIDLEKIVRKGHGWGADS